LVFYRCEQKCSVFVTCIPIGVTFVTGIPIGVLQSVFSRVAMDQFELPANYNGFVMSYIGIVTMVSHPIE